MRISTWTVIAILAGACAARAEEPADGLIYQPRAMPTVPATQPFALATAASVDPAILPGLVAKLDDDNPKVRTQAATELRGYGTPALAALQAGARQESLQVRVSCEDLIDRIEHPEKYVRPEAPPINPFAMAPRQAGVRVLHLGNAAAPGNALELFNNFSRDISVISNGRSIRIHQDPNGLRVQIKQDGKLESFDARTPADLKAKSEEAFKLYEQYAKAAWGQ